MKTNRIVSLSGGALCAAAAEARAIGSRMRRSLRRTLRTAQPDGPRPLVPLAILLGIGLLAAGLWTYGGEQKRHAGLKRTGELRLQEAAQIALDNFRITRAELEDEDGRPIWSFDIVATGLDGLLAVAVDARTGEVMSVEVGQPDDESTQAEEGPEAATEETGGPVSLEELTPPARAAVEKLTAGGNIEKIDQETEKGRVIYDVEATVGGKHVEYTITTDGTVAGTETAIEFSALPEGVRKAAQKYFGGPAGLKPSKCVEDGQTTYEIEGNKEGKTVAVTFDPDGEMLEEEQ